MKYNLKQMLKQADENGYAIPAFNYSDIWELKGILAAANELKAPVIVATNSQVSATISIPWLGALGQVFMGESDIPVINHLDHCKKPELCFEAIDHGYASVMIDGSALPLEENIEVSRIVAEYAADKNVCVEAEVGRIRGSNVEGTYLGDDFLVNVADAVAMAERTGIDSLAVGIGNAHGFYTGKPQLNFDRLREVNDAVKIPLVLHGGTGIPEHDIRKAIKNGINKVNIGTQMHFSYLEALKKELSDGRKRTNIVEAMQPVVDAVKTEAKRWIVNCMADGKA